jgi:hypothetical protein
MWAQTAASALYSAYKTWCEDSGGDALNSRRFGSMVAVRAGVTKKRMNAGHVYVSVGVYDGVAIFTVSG